MLMLMLMPMLGRPLRHMHTPASSMLFSSVTLPLIPAKNQPLDRAASAAAFETITKEINEFRRAQGDDVDMTPEEVALGFLRVANEAMCRPVRSLTQVSILGGAYSSCVWRHTVCL
jgi:N-methylhydantoinase A/oxoprolinase/acetone carboxylase beta subunit